MSRTPRDEASGSRGRRARLDKGREPIRREALQDTRATFRARGVLASILSRPDDWRASADSLARENPGERRDAIGTALTELERLGYLCRERVRYSDGTCGWLWLYDDDPGALAEAIPAALEEIGATVIARRQKPRPRVDPAIPPARDGRGTFSQVTPTTDKPNSAEPTSVGPSSAQPESYIERRQIPLTPSSAELDDEDDTPPAPGKPGGQSSLIEDEPPVRVACQQHGESCHRRACGRAPRQVAASARVAYRAAAHEDAVAAQLARREAGVEARRRASGAGGDARRLALERAQAPTRRRSPMTS